MTPEQAKEAARLLIAARRDGHKITLDDSLRPRDVTDGYRVQEAMIAAAPWPLVGWKVGATATVFQQRLGVPEPFAGPLFAPFVFVEPAEVALHAAHGVALECEYAFRLARPLPARPAPYDDDTVAVAVGAMHLAVELIQRRAEDPPPPIGPQLIGDSGGNGGLVLGPAVADWRRRDFVHERVRLLVNDAQVAEGDGTAVLGHPLSSLTWLANHLSRTGRGLAADAVVTTGSCTGLTPAKFGDAVVGDYARLGRVGFALAAIDWK